MEVFDSEPAEGPVAAESAYRATSGGHRVSAASVAHTTGEFLRTVFAPR